LFTGEDKNSGKVGHLGFVYQNDKSGFQFIHSASGNKKGVMVSNMSPYFYERFIKIINYFDE
jgi:phosphoribosylaminoimidazole-succinocarboxamide synthase